MSEKNDILEEGQIYELGFHVLPTVPEEKLQEVVSKLDGFIAQNGGQILSAEFPRMRGLSYDIKKRVDTKYLNFDKAYFGWIKFEAPRISVDKIEKGVKDDKNILRFIIIKTVKENTMHIPKSPVMVRSNATEETKVPADKTVEKTEVSEAEIDKSIDELVIDQTL